MTGDQALAVLELLGDLLNAGRTQAGQLAAAQTEVVRLSAAVVELSTPPADPPAPVARTRRAPAKRAAKRG